MAQNSDVVKPGIPALEVIYAAIREKHPDQKETPPEQVRAMKLVFDLALPRVVTGLQKKRTKDHTKLHMEHLPGDRWIWEVSTAIHMLHCYSNMENIEKNLGKEGPRSRKRADAKLDFAAEYFGVCKQIRKFTTEEDFPKRMEKWDEITCGLKKDATTVAPPPAEDTYDWFGDFISNHPKLKTTLPGGAV